MNDSWTTDANWIETEEVKWSLTHPRSRLYTAQFGISQEIFEKGRHQASLFIKKELPNIERGQESVHVNVGAYILKVKLNSVLLELKDTFQTADYRLREYRIEAILRVNNPVFFAESYYRGNDPVYAAKKAIQARVKEYAERTEDRQIDRYILRHHVESALHEPVYASLGIELARVVEFYLSLSTQEQNARNKRDENDIQTITAEGEEDVADVHSDGARRRKAKDRIGDISIDKLAKKVEHGTASSQDLEFLFGSSQRGSILPPTPERRQLRAGRKGERDEAHTRGNGQSSPSSSEPADQALPGERSTATFSDTWLGISLRLHTLSDEEQSDLQLRHNTVFRVLKVNETGPLAGSLQEGDLVLKIAGQPAHDIPTLRQILEELMDEGSDSLTIRIDRDEQSYDIHVDIR